VGYAGRRSLKVEDAEALYKKAIGLYVEAGRYFIITSNAKLRQSLQLFNQLMTSIPTVRIDEAAIVPARFMNTSKIMNWRQ
jgi:hypothetical protein